MAETVKNLPTMQEKAARSLGQEDPLEEKKATHSRILAWKIPRTEEPSGLQSMRSQRVDTTERLIQQQQQQGYTQQNLGNKKFYRKKKNSKEERQSNQYLKST